MGLHFGLALDVMGGYLKLRMPDPRFEHKGIKLFFSKGKEILVGGRYVRKYNLRKGDLKTLLPGPRRESDNKRWKTRLCCLRLLNFFLCVKGNIFQTLSYFMDVFMGFFDLKSSSKCV
mgnify:CR=1 FL=1